MKLMHSMVLLAISCVFALQCKSTRNRNFQDLEADAVSEEPVGWSNACSACLCTLATQAEALGYKPRAAKPEEEFNEKHNWCERNWACNGVEYAKFIPDLKESCSQQVILLRWQHIRDKAVCVYEHSFFGGAEQCYTTGDIPDLGELWGDKISSIRIFGNAELEYWEHPNFQGNGRKTTAQWIPRLEDPLDKQVSSMRIR